MLPKLRIVLLSHLLILAAGPLLAYTIYLKDGSTIIAQEKYTIDAAGRALITLQSGTQTFLDASEIDAARTEAANRENLGSAMLLENGRVKALPVRPAPSRQTLGGLIAQGKAGTRSRPGVRRQTRRTEVRRGQTRAGFTDLLAIEAAPYPDFDLVSEIRTFLASRGIEEVQVEQGTGRRRPLLEIRTNSEASVFRALQASAEALLLVRERFPDRVEALEVLMATSQRTRAGQFVLTPELAAELTSGALEPSSFFVRHVQF